MYIHTFPHPAYRNSSLVPVDTTLPAALSMQDNPERWKARPSCHSKVPRLYRDVFSRIAGTFRLSMLCPTFCFSPLTLSFPTQLSTGFEARRPPRPAPVVCLSPAAHSPSPLLSFFGPHLDRRKSLPCPSAVRKYFLITINFRASWFGTTGVPWSNYV